MKSKKREEVVCYFLLAIVLIGINISLFSMEAKANVYTYEILSEVDKTAMIKGISYQTSNDLYLPDSVYINGVEYTITEIRDNAFSIPTITGELKLPRNVEKIGSRAFYESKLTGNLILPDSLKTIDDYAFYKCNFEGDLIIPNSVTQIGNAAFGNGKGFTGKLSIGQSVQEIGDGAFDKCGFSGELIIPNSVTTIGGGAFSRCDGFTGRLVIPNGLTEISGEAFYGCSGFTGELIIPDSVIEIGANAFLGCGFTGELIIPDSVIEIGECAFGNCCFSGNLTIPNSVELIERYAFSDTYFDGKLTLGNRVREIGEGAFRECGFIGDLVIPNSVYYIDDLAFLCCDFTRVKILNLYVLCGYEIFSGCYNVRECSMSCGVEFDDGLSGLPSNCKVKMIHPDFETTTTKATLTKNGKNETKCTNCGAIIESKTIYAAKTVKLIKTAYVYDGRSKKPSITVKDSKGNTIATTNYSIKYPASRENVGKYTVKITFKGDYSGTKNLTFKIYPKSTTINTVTPLTKGFTVKWERKEKQVDGYEIQYATNDKFSTGLKKIVTVKKNTVTSKKITKLKSKKTYYVRIRTYKKVGTKKYYSAWSKVMQVKTK